LEVQINAFDFLKNSIGEVLSLIKEYETPVLKQQLSADKSRKRYAFGGLVLSVIVAVLLGFEHLSDKGITGSVISSITITPLAFYLFVGVVALMGILFLLNAWNKHTDYQGCKNNFQVLDQVKNELVSELESLNQLKQQMIKNITVGEE